MKFIGLSNYKKLLLDTYFLKAVSNTLVFLIIHIPLQVGIALLLAFLLQRQIKMSGFYRSVFFLPVVVSGVVVSVLWQQLYSFDLGILNQLLTSLGLSRIGWLIDPKWAMASIAIMATWKNVGLYIILFLVGLQGVPRSLYEAAELEGANDWQKFRFITLPAINPTMFMVVILSTISGFSLFIEPYVMTGGGPLNSTLSAVLYIYKQGFFYYHMGYAATLGLTFAVLILLVVALQRKYLEKT
jgi:ABC-type sugar transport system permease subunit